MTTYFNNESPPKLTAVVPNSYAVTAFTPNIKRTPISCPALGYHSAPASPYKESTDPESKCTMDDGQFEKLLRGEQMVVSVQYDANRLTLTPPHHHHTSSSAFNSPHTPDQGTPSHRIMEEVPSASPTPVKYYIQTADGGCNVPYLYPAPKQAKDNINPKTGKANIDPKKYKTRMCRTFQKTGACSYEHTCCFAHGNQELRNSQTNISALSSLGYFSNRSPAPQGPQVQYTQPMVQPQAQFVTTNQPYSTVMPVPQQSLPIFPMEMGQINHQFMTIPQQGGQGQVFLVPVQHAQYH